MCIQQKGDILSKYNSNNNNSNNSNISVIECVHVVLYIHGNSFGFASLTDFIFVIITILHILII